MFIDKIHMEILNKKRANKQKISKEFNNTMLSIYI
jgi:hypothetical protein